MKTKKHFQVILIMTLISFVIHWGYAQTIAMNYAKTETQRETTIGTDPIVVLPAIEKTNFVVRDIFRLQFGHYKEAIALIDEAIKTNLFPPGSIRILTDFTGDAYRLILEAGYNSLADYEKSLSSELNAIAWRDWYEKFKPHVASSSREILRWVR